MEQNTSTEDCNSADNISSGDAVNGDHCSSSVSNGDTCMTSDNKAVSNTEQTADKQCLATEPQHQPIVDPRFVFLMRNKSEVSNPSDNKNPTKWVYSKRSATELLENHISVGHLTKISGPFVFLCLLHFAS